MKSTYAGLVALAAVSVLFFTLAPAHAGMAGLKNLPNAGNATQFVHLTGKKHRGGMLSDGLAYGLAVASQFSSSRNFDDYAAKGREFHRDKGCPTGTALNEHNSDCFWAVPSKRKKWLR